MHVKSRKRRTRVKKTEKIKWFDIVATWFFMGHSPFMPGTIGSLGAYPLLYFSIMSSEDMNEARFTMLIIVSILCVIGYFAIREYHKKTGIIDDQSIVIDEVIGQLITFIIAYEWINSALYKFAIVNADTPPSLIVTYAFLLGFIPFRFFDITKPLYISLIDRYWLNAVGVILDDVLAGIYAGLIFYALR